ncbi:immunoglobulin-binding protein 1-like [Acipenser ruthenus]|uniref:immunoglobulin-binding protein 1-like n=1 Tax=Acipenser ruthenus TaxID=7906 RepID=UPI00145AFEC8|nr:immunoglobulin-binding protein 1-like [Acipenser ruthenus]XP_058857554.1 immunoglobulin-binding protein 1-like [Acipenser ruthenus]
MASAAVTSESQASDADQPKLSDLIDNGWKLYEEVESTNEPTSSLPIQVKIKRGVSKLEEATRMVAQLDLFSRNEELEEIATADLKYVLLPALLGALTMKETNPSRRLEQVQKARVYFLDFLKRCKEYNIMKFELPKATQSPEESNETGEDSSSGTPALPSNPPDLVAMAVHRNAKIERYNQKKETEAKLSEIRVAVDSGQAEDEVVRDFYLLNARRWVTIALEEIESIDQEVQILKRMGSLKKDSAHSSRQQQRPPMKPFILTKDAVQARVFGAGYPSLPTMTVNDWYEQHRRQGALPDQGIPKSAADLDNEEREEEEKERQIGNDNEEALQRARDWDNWKDTHRRGYGNRKNMG